MTIDELINNDDDFDGVYFCKSDEKGDENWSITFLKLENKRDKKFEEYDFGIKYQIMLHENDKVEVFEAILGDPRQYLRNMIQCEQEGMIIKKCKKSDKILSKILGKHNFHEFRAIFGGT